MSARSRWLPAAGTTRPSRDGEVVAATNLASDVDKRTMRWAMAPAIDTATRQPPDAMDHGHGSLIPRPPTSVVTYARALTMPAGRRPPVLPRRLCRRPWPTTRVLRGVNHRSMPALTCARKPRLQLVTTDYPFFFKKKKLSSHVAVLVLRRMYTFFVFCSLPFVFTS